MNVLVMQIIFKIERIRVFRRLDGPGHLPAVDAMGSNRPGAQLGDPIGRIPFAGWRTGGMASTGARGLGRRSSVGQFIDYGRRQ